MNFFTDIQTILQSNKTIFVFFFFFLGCCFASFFNVVILRYPKMIESTNANDVKAWFEEKNIPFPEILLPLLKPLNLSFPASHCFSCHTPLKWYHNIPLLSYLFLRGKCGFCHTHISYQYPLVEFLGGVVLSLCYWFAIDQGIAVFSLWAFVALTCYLLAAIDLSTFLLPDFLNYALLWTGLLFIIQGVSLLPITVNDAVGGAIAGYVALWIIASVGKLVKREEVMGGGDLKLLAALGVFVGVKGAIFTVFFSPFIGIFTWIICKLFFKGQRMVPYGPSLIAGAITYILYGKEILHALNIMI